MKQAILLLFGILVLAGSCGDKVDKEIAQVMKQRENAYNSKNLELYTSILSENYLNKTDDRNETKKVAVKNFKINTTPFDIIDMRHRDRTIYKEGDSAKVVQKTYVLLEIDNKKNNFEQTEIIFLAKEENTWKIVKESNIDLFRGYVFGKGK